MNHYCDIIMSAMASQITGVSILCSVVFSGINQRKLQSSASLAFLRGIHRSPVNSPHKGPVTRKMFPFDDVIMRSSSYMSRQHAHIVVKGNEDVMTWKCCAHCWPFVKLIHRLPVGLPPKDQYDSALVFSLLLIKLTSLKWPLRSCDISWHSAVVSGTYKRNFKATRHWLLWGKSTGYRWIPLTKGQWRGNGFHLMTSSYISGLDVLIAIQWNKQLNSLHCLWRCPSI